MLKSSAFSLNQRFQSPHLLKHRAFLWNLHIAVLNLQSVNEKKFQSLFKILTFGVNYKVVITTANTEPCKPFPRLHRMHSPQVSPYPRTRWERWLSGVTLSQLVSGGKGESGSGMQPTDYSKAQHLTHQAQLPLKCESNVCRTLQNLPESLGFREPRVPWGRWESTF